jgi:hypothetical protein
MSDELCMKRSFDTGVGRFTVFGLFLLTLTAIDLAGFLTQPTIDFDEGWFFQSAVHATKTGVPGFPWSDVYFEKSVPYIPLNSLVPLVNWPIAFLPETMWLIVGRLVSATAVLCGLIVLLFGGQYKMARRNQYAAAALVLLCHPLLLHGRMIRPEALAFFTFCAALTFAQQPRLRAAFLGGIAAGLCVLVHLIHGALAVLVIAACPAVMPAIMIKQRLAQVFLVLVGAFLPIALFYSWYVSIAGVATVWQQIAMLVAMAPRSVTSYSLNEHLVAWLSYISAQLNLVPLLGMAAVALIVPVNSNDPRARFTRLFQAAIIGFMIFWIFVYPKKAFSPVVLLLPLVWFIFGGALGETRRKVLLVGLSACLLANVILLARYHWRIIHDENGQQQLVPIQTQLEEQGLLRPKTRIMAKLWLVFALPADVTLWDITVFPRILWMRLGNDKGTIAALDRTDAVVLERVNAEWVDRQQAAIAEYCRAQGWEESHVLTTRYFTSLEAVIFISSKRAQTQLVHY